MSNIRDLLIRRHTLNIERWDKQPITPADLRAVAAYLEALSISPHSCDVTIGHLRLQLEMDE